MAELTQEAVAQAKARIVKMLSFRDRIVRSRGGHEKHEAMAESHALRALLAAYEELKADLDGTVGFIGFRAATKVWKARTKERGREIERLVKAELAQCLRANTVEAKLAEAQREIERMVRVIADCPDCLEALAVYEQQDARAALAASPEPKCPKHGPLADDGKCDVCEARGIWEGCAASPEHGEEVRRG